MLPNTGVLIENGVDKWKNWHTLMNEKHLPKSYWAEAANTTVYLINRCTTSGVHNITPHEKFYGKKSDLSHFTIFGSIAYVYIPTRSDRSSILGWINVS